MRSQAKFNRNLYRNICTNQDTLNLQNNFSDMLPIGRRKKKINTLSVVCLVKKLQLTDRSNHINENNRKSVN